MKKIILAGFCLMFISCSAPNFNSFRLSNDENSNSFSSLSELFGASALFPPKDIVYGIEYNADGALVRLDWKSIPDAAKYVIYTGTKELQEQLLKEADKNTATMFVPLNAQTGKIEIWYSIASVNVNKKYSSKSVPFSVVVGSDEVFSGKAENLIISRGTEKAILLTWTPVPGSSWYEIRRYQTGSQSVEIIDSKYYPVNPAANTISFSDTSITSGYLYDYEIIPFNMFGRSGTVSERKNGGYSLCGILEPDASMGSLIRSNNGTPQYDDDYSCIEIKWRIRPFLSDSSGEQKDKKILPNKFKFFVSEKAATAYYSELETVFRPDFAGSGLLKPLVTADASCQSIPTGYTHDASVPQLFYKEIVENNQTYYEYVYRLKVNYVDFSSLGFSSPWYYFYYFKVSAMYEIAGQPELFETYQSQVCRGWAINPVAPNYEAVVEENFSCSLNTSNVPVIKFSKANIKSSPIDKEFSSYIIYSKDSSDIKYIKIIEMTAEEAATAQYTFNDLSAQQGVLYSYKMSFKDDSGMESSTTPSVSVKIPVKE